MLLVVVVAGCLPKDGGWSEAAQAYVPKEVPLETCSLVDGSVDEMLDDAMKAWNRAVGCRIFVRGHDCDLVASGGVAYKDPVTGKRTDGDAWYDPAQQTYYARVLTHITTTSTYLIWMHELGHTLGLEHDRWKRSVMYEGSHAPLPRDGALALDRGPPWPLVTHQDRKLVRKRYCR
jgi:hypothetical protein